MAIIKGTARRDILRGTTANDTISGLAGNDDLIGGKGADKLLGGLGHDKLFGKEGNDTLVGDRGDDLLDGGTGRDTMSGGLGNDRYLVDNARDIVRESTGQGTDTVRASVTHVLAANVENLVLTGTALNGTGNALDNVITGNARANTLNGGFGNDTLNGGTGADTMNGGSGNDRYLVDNVLDVVVEDPNGIGPNIDTVLSAVAYALGDNLENLVLLGSAETGVGNALDNTITGNAVGNFLSGAAGADTLNGLTGNDLLNGGLGGDTLDGGEGIDTADYRFGTVGINVNLSTGSVLGDAAGDTLNSIENVIGTNQIDTIEGNNEANTLTGLDGADTLIGGFGADTLIGGEGDDFLFPVLKANFAFAADNAGDHIDGGSGVDTVSYVNQTEAVVVNLVTGLGSFGDTFSNVESVAGGQGADGLTSNGGRAIGNGGADFLSGDTAGVKHDFLIGGEGADVFIMRYSTAPGRIGDNITDFVAGDKIGVSKSGLGLASNFVMTADNLVITAGAITTTMDDTPQFVYHASGVLYFDPNGSTGIEAELVLVAVIDTQPATLALADFLVIA